MADEAVHIGPGPVNESYLVVANIFAAAASGAEAIHPGYGFSVEERGVRTGLRGRRPGVYRPAPRRHSPDGQ
jgi:acetyl/propionyl-CoA carboxylase alpha subunit